MIPIALQVYLLPLYVMGVIFIGVFVVMIWGGLLMGACAICRVETPPLSKAMGIVFCMAVVNLILARGIEYCVGTDPNSGTRGIFACLLPLSMFLSAFFYSVMIPTSYARGILIWATQQAIPFAIAFAVLAAIQAMGTAARF